MAVATKKTKSQNLGYVAKLNKEKTEILNVYLDRKTAAQMNGYESSSSLDNHVKNHTLTKNNYYTLYDECDEELKNNFLIPLAFMENKFYQYFYYGF